METDMLIGEKGPENIAARVAGHTMLIALLSPWFLMGAGSFLVGLMAVGPRRHDIPELWVCVPTGAALLLVVGLITHWFFWRLPRMTVSSFEYDGSTLVTTSPAQGTVARAIGDLRSVAEDRGRRGSRILGWWLGFEDGGRVYLSQHTSNAVELVRRIVPPVE